MKTPGLAGIHNSFERHLSAGRVGKMTSKIRKMKERRRQNQWTLLERRKGELWMYAQVPVFVGLSAWFVNLVR